MKSRNSQITQLSDGHFDVLIIGGGINGAAAAAALSRQDLAVALVDAQDFSGYSSQSSSGLIWGGIKYLQTLEFPLVRQLCRQRNELIQAYPSTVRERRFLFSFKSEERIKRWVLWCGTWLYWLLGSAATAAPSLLTKSQVVHSEPGLSAADIVGGVEYSDATLTDGDARFVFNLIDSATQGGCVAVNYLAVKGLQFGKDNDWTVKLFDGVKLEALSLKARVLVNAAGPFADSINQLAGVRTRHRHVYSKGIHLVVKRVSQGSRVLSFFADDGRPLFVIPTGDRSSLGTTDTPVDQPDTHVTERDRRFVLDNINRALGTPGKFTPADVISERCGVRALAVSGVVDEGQDFLQLSRRHTVEVDRAHGMVTIFGGKLTSCLSVGRKIKTHVLALLDRMNEGQREDGFGESGTRARDEFLRCATRIFEADAHLVDVAKRLWRYYGEGANQILAAIQLDPSRAAFILPEYGVTRAELEFVQATQMVVTLDDYLRRRTLLSVTTRKEDLAALAGMMEVCRILFGDRAKIEYEKTFSL